MPKDLSPEEVNEIIVKIYKHVAESHILNGGFNKILFKVEEISQTVNEVSNEVNIISVRMDGLDEKTEQIDTQVKQIEQSLNNPESGLYSKFKSLEFWKTAKEENEKENKQKSGKFKYFVVGFMLSLIVPIITLILEHHK
jgi:uncharacterized phage infection (PIP) family protein YhgE